MSGKDDSRDHQIIRASGIGIAANLALSGSKAAVGALSGSIAIILDAVNNLTDALSAVLTLIGTKLAGKPADKEHPFGHGRIEYITTIAVAFVVAGAGVSSLVESARKLAEPSETSYGPVGLAILAAAVAVKLVLSAFYLRVGRQTESETLKDTGADARFDAVITGATLLCALLNIWLGPGLLWLDGALGLCISLVIIRAGIIMMLSPLDGLLGKRSNHELAEQIRRDILSHDDVLGVFDLMIHDYGPRYRIGSVHIEVDDSMSAHRIHDLTRHLQKDLMDRYGIMFTIGIYACNCNDPSTTPMYRHIMEMLRAMPEVIQVHGLYIDPRDRTISFDTVVKFGIKDSAALQERIRKAVSDAYPGYSVDNGIDYDYTLS